MPKINRVKYEAQKEAKAELKRPHVSPNSVTKLRERVTLLEVSMGIISTND